MINFKNILISMSRTPGSVGLCWAMGLLSFGFVSSSLGLAILWGAAFFWLFPMLIKRSYEATRRMQIQQQNYIDTQLPHLAELFIDISLTFMRRCGGTPDDERHCEGALSRKG